MKVLLTGATGFVGSHVLDALRAESIPVVVLVRQTSRLGFIAPHGYEVEIRHGSLNAPDTLAAALQGVTHVVHTAGLTKAVQAAEFSRVNRDGVRTLVEAVNDRGGAIQRFVHVSSLAAAGPAVAAAPSAETDLPRPVSEYGRSKLAGEEILRRRCAASFTILRPPAVYGPRDREFLPVFRAAARKLRPVFGGGAQELSLVYATDLARVVLSVLRDPRAVGETFNVAGPEVVTGDRFTAAVATALEVRARRLPLPLVTLRLAAAAQAVWSRISGRAGILAHGKYAELSAPGWVCDVSKLRDRIGCECSTGLDQGLAATARWYRRQGWL